jgi:cytochrome c553
LLLLIQLVPYGRDHTIRAATNPFKWNSPEAEAVAKASCYDCHSNETKWWWAVKIAPFSWLAQNDIDSAQRRVNFSEWKGSLTVEGMQRAINRDMPPLQYTLFHPDAKLTETKRQSLMQGFRTSLSEGTGTSPVEPLAVSASADATAIINARCSRCHSPSAALRFRASNTDKARALIDRMVQQGARVSPAEEQVLINKFTS